MCWGGTGRGGKRGVYTGPEGAVVKVGGGMEEGGGRGAENEWSPPPVGLRMVPVPGGPVGGWGGGPT